MGNSRQKAKKKRAAQRQPNNRQRQRKATPTAQPRCRRLFIFLGNDDGFFPGKLMQLLNKLIRARQKGGHFDLLSRFSYIDGHERNAELVMTALNGVMYKGREVRCNDADKGAPQRRPTSDGGDGFSRYEKKSKRRNADADHHASEHGERAGSQQARQSPQQGRQEAKSDDWRQFFNNDKIELVGEEPDFSEEGWAMRKSRKK